MVPNFTGVWKANLEKSKFLSSPPKAILIKIVHTERDLYEEILLTNLNGREQRIIFKCLTNGEQDANSVNGNAVRGSSRWEGQELIIESWIQIGTREMHFCDCWSLSPDGNILSMEHRNDDLAGQLTILDRVT